MDGLSAAGGAFAVVSIAIQLAESAKKLYEFIDTAQSSESKLRQLLLVCFPSLYLRVRWQHLIVIFGRVSVTLVKSLKIQLGMSKTQFGQVKCLSSLFVTLFNHVKCLLKIWKSLSNPDFRVQNQEGARNYGGLSRVHWLKRRSKPSKEILNQPNSLYSLLGSLQYRKYSH
jgi:hypothetical protein